MGPTQYIVRATKSYPIKEYWHIPIAKSDVPKTAFVTHNGTVVTNFLECHLGWLIHL